MALEVDCRAVRAVDAHVKTDWALAERLKRRVAKRAAGAEQLVTENAEKTSAVNPRRVEREPR